MNRSLMILLVVILFSSVANSATKVAVVYNAFHNYQYRDEMTSILTPLDYKFDMYENTHLSDLIPKLPEYDLVLLNAVYNYENTQNFSKYAVEWRNFLISGGCFVSTDTNYPQQFEWLMSVDPGLKWIGSGAINPVGDSPIKWVDKTHPLMKDVVPPGTPWTHPSSWSQALVPLASDGTERPVIAYLELGKGIAVISSAYRQYRFPDSVFLRNLMEWVDNPDRLDSITRRSAMTSSQSRLLPVISIPYVATGADTPRNGALIDGLDDFNGNRSVHRTTIRVASGNDMFHVVFESHDSVWAPVNPAERGRDFELWRGNCVEVFLKPSDIRPDIYHFAVDPSGYKYDALNGDTNWDAYWNVKTNARNGILTTAIDIPYTSLGITSRDTAAGTWAANFVRRYKGANRSDDEISGWSPSPAGFDIPEKFGALKGLKVGSSRYPYGSELVIIQPSRWIVGRNKVAMDIGKQTDKRPEVVIECIEPDTGAILSSKSFSSKADSKVVMDIPIDRDGPLSMQFILRDTERRNRIYSSSRVIKAYIKPPMTATLISPSFRNTIQSRDPNKQIRIECDIADGVALGTYLQADIVPTGREIPIWQMIYPIKSNVKKIVTASLADAPVGGYTVTVELLNKANTILSRREFKITILPPAPTEVSFSQNGICRINGKPFFPIGLYHVAPVVLNRLNDANREAGLPAINLCETLTGIKEIGFNIVHHTWGMPDDEYMEIAQNLGLYVIPEIGAPDTAILKSYVEMANRYDNLLMWYGLDEPSGERLKTAIAAHDMYTRIDPHRPVSAAICNPTVFKDAVQAYDILMMDPYFIRFAPLSRIAEWMKTGLEATGGRKPIWVIPQAFTISSSPWSEPTPEELRCQAYISLVHGATGLIWYAFWTNEPYLENPKGRKQWYLPDSKLWDYFKILNQEIKEFAPVVMNGDSIGPAKSDSDQIHTNIWRWKGITYIAAVNPTDKLITCSISTPNARSAMVTGENREIAIHTGILRDEFLPLAVHIYSLRGPVVK